MTRRVGVAEVHAITSAPCNLLGTMQSPRHHASQTIHMHNVTTLPGHPQRQPHRPPKSASSATPRLLAPPHLLLQGPAIIRAQQAMLLLLLRGQVQRRHDGHGP